MSDYRIIFTRPEDGGLSIVVPAEGITQEQALKSVPAGAEYEIVPLTEILTDRTFRNAWKKEGKKIGHDMVKAKAIAHEKRRAARTVEFQPLDVEATIPSKSAQAEVKRQNIRDKYDAMQATIDSAATIQDLKASIIDIL